MKISQLVYEYRGTIVQLFHATCYGLPTMHTHNSGMNASPVLATTLTGLDFSVSIVLYTFYSLQIFVLGPWL